MKKTSRNVNEYSIGGTIGSVKNVGGTIGSVKSIAGTIGSVK